MFLLGSPKADHMKMPKLTRISHVTPVLEPIPGMIKETPAPMVRVRAAPEPELAERMMFLRFIENLHRTNKMYHNTIAENNIEAMEENKNFTRDEATFGVDVERESVITSARSSVIQKVTNNGIPKWTSASTNGEQRQPIDYTRNECPRPQAQMPETEVKQMTIEEDFHLNATRDIIEKFNISDKKLDPKLLKMSTDLLKHCSFTTLIKTINSGDTKDIKQEDTADEEITTVDTVTRKFLDTDQFTIEEMDLVDEMYETMSNITRELIRPEFYKAIIDNWSGMISHSEMLRVMAEGRLRQSTIHILIMSSLPYFNYLSIR